MLTLFFLSKLNCVIGNLGFILFVLFVNKNPYLVEIDYLKFSDSLIKRMLRKIIQFITIKNKY